MTGFLSNEALQSACYAFLLLIIIDYILSIFQPYEYQDFKYRAFSGATLCRHLQDNIEKPYSGLQCCSLRSRYIKLSSDCYSENVSSMTIIFCCMFLNIYLILQSIYYIVRLIISKIIYRPIYVYIYIYIFNLIMCQLYKIKWIKTKKLLLIKLYVKIGLATSK